MTVLHVRWSSSGSSAGTPLPPSTNTFHFAGVDPSVFARRSLSHSLCPSLPLCLSLSLSLSELFWKLRQHAPAAVDPFSLVSEEGTT